MMMCLRFSHFCYSFVCLDSQLLTWQAEGAARDVEGVERGAVEGDGLKADFSHIAAWDGGMVLEKLK